MSTLTLPSPEEVAAQMACTPSFRGVLAPLSNMAPARVFNFPSLEHAYVASKSTNPALRQRIRQEPHAHRAKCLGNPRHKLCIIRELRPDWERIKLDVMRTLVREKFSRHPHLAELLLATGEVPIVERNPWMDFYWGSCNGRGTNRLGRILEETRRDLRSGAPPLNG